MTITVNRDVFLHPDFAEDLRQTLCEYLNALIDAELEKEEADFDFIDECVNAINLIREDFVNVIPVISKKDFLAKLGIRTGRVSKTMAAVVAAAIMLVAGNSAIASATDFNIFEEVSQRLAALLSPEEEMTLPPTTEPQFTEPQTTKAQTKPTSVPQKKEENIKLTFADGFKTEYTVGEKLDLSGLRVALVYDDMTEAELTAEEYKITASPNFGKVAGYETVKVTYGGFEQIFSVRILNSEATPLLSSVYAIFPQDYDFTAEDLSNIDLSFMQVYAVYSDGSEKEIGSDEYTVDVSDISTLFEKKALVTVSYETCSCSFTVFKE